MRNCLLLFSALLLARHTTGQAPGEFIDTLKCVRTPQFSYALYVPVALSAESKVLVFLEPGSRGRLPVEKYQMLADSFNIILASSYQARNDPMADIEVAVYATLDDVRERLTLAPGQVMLAGFSGGARAAVSLALHDKQFEVVFACGAAFPVGERIVAKKKIPFVEMVGKRDMNFREAEDANDYLNSIGNPSLLLTFDGGHDWPPARLFADALRWHRYITHANDDGGWIDFVKRQTDAAIQKLDSGKMWEGYTMLDQMKRQPGTSPKVDSMMQQIAADATWKKTLREAQRLRSLEVEWQTRFFDKYTPVLRAGADTAFHVSEWMAVSKEIRRLRESKDEAKQLVGERLFDLMWRYCAEQGFNYYQGGALERASLCYQIWVALDGDRPLPYLSLARVRALSGRQDEALSYLNKAVDRGFSNKSFLMKDKAFVLLHNDPKFILVIERLK